MNAEKQYRNVHKFIPIYLQNVSSTATLVY